MKCRRGLLACAGVAAALSACRGNTPAGSASGSRIGLVVNGSGGPVPGAKVKVASQAVVTTGADGTFSVQGVAAPYDIAVVSASGTAAAVYVWLTRGDPIIGIPLAGSGPPSPTSYAATVQGKLSGGAGFPQPTGHAAQFFLSGPASASAYISNSTLNTDGSYTLTFSRTGSTTLSGTLRALQWLKDANQNPTSFDGYGSLSVTVSANQTLIAQNINLDVVTNGPIGGTATVAPGYTLGGRSLRAFFPQSDSLLIRFDNNFGGGTVSPGYSYPGFSAGGVVFKVTAFAQNAANAFSQVWRAGFALGSTADLNVPAAPVIQAAGPSATAVTAGSTLSWTGLPGTVYDLVVSPSTVGAGPTLRIVTGATSFQIPDLSAMGFAWPKSQTYRIDLHAYGPRSPDDVAGGNERPPDDQDGVYAAAVPGWFTTAP